MSIQFSHSPTETKIDKVINELEEHPFVIQNPEIVRDIANFRVNSLRKFK